MANYRSTLYKLRIPKVFRIHDFLAVAVLIWLLISALSFTGTVDLKAGFNEASGTVSAAKEAAFNEEMLSEQVYGSSIAEWFFSSSVHSGGLVYSAANYEYIIYDDLEEGKGYYKGSRDFSETEALKSSDEDLAPGIASVFAYMSIREDGTIYYDNLSGKYGPTTEKVDLSELPDCEQIYGLLNTASKTDKLPK